MCLKNTNFSLKYNPGSRDYIGVGYKVLEKNEVGRLGRWKEATGDYSYKGKLKDSVQYTDDYKSQYHPGFHIWTELESAKDYAKAVGNESVYKVEYKNVIAFGTNYCSGGAYKNCVISRHMKVVEKIS